MNWLFPSLLAPAVYALVVFIDKYLLEKEIKDYRGMPIFASIAGFISGTIIWIIAGFPVLTFFDGLLVITTGILTAISFAAYYEAVSSEEASNINLLFQMFPVIILILSFLFLRETINIRQIFGFGLILSSVLGVASNGKQRNGRFHLSKAFYLILIYDIFLAISAVLMKFAINKNSFADVLAYQSWGVGLGGVALYIFSSKIRIAFKNTIKTVRKIALGIMFFNEFVFVIGRSLTYFAFSLGSTALVSVLEGTQVFYGVFYGMLATIFIPRVLKENISKTTTTKKILFSIILFLGIWLINV